MNYLVQEKTIFLTRRQVSISTAWKIRSPTWKSIASRSSRSLKLVAIFNSNVKIVFCRNPPAIWQAKLSPRQMRNIHKTYRRHRHQQNGRRWYHILYNTYTGIRASSLRLTNTYGPHLLINTIAMGFMTVFIFASCSMVKRSKYSVTAIQIRDFIYVQDVVDALSTRRCI